QGIRSPSLCRQMANLRKPLTLEEFLGQMQRSEAEGSCAHESEPRRLGWRLRCKWRGADSNKPRRPHEGQPTYELASAQPCSSVSHEDSLCREVVVRKMPPQGIRSVYWAAPASGAAKTPASEVSRKQRRSITALSPLIRPQAVFHPLLGFSDPSANQAEKDTGNADGHREAHNGES